MELQKLKNVIEALLFSADKPMDIRHLDNLFEPDEDRPTKDEIRQALQSIQEDCQGRGIQLREVSSGYRMQVCEDYASWISRLWEEKVPRYSRALLETLVLIVYRQPITRGEIEDIRGVSVSSHIIKTLLEREWVRVLGHKDVPGKPAMYGSTREFLDYFNLKTLDDLPPLSDIKDLDKLHPELELDEEVPATSVQDAETPTEDGGSDDSVTDEAAEQEVDSEAEQEVADTDNTEELAETEQQPESDEQNDTRSEEEIAQDETSVDERLENTDEAHEAPSDTGSSESDELETEAQSH